MLTVAVELCSMALAALAGIGLGWWLGIGRGGQMASYDAGGAGMDYAGEVLARLQDLATSMASNVGQHSTRVQEVQKQLAKSKQDGPDGVVHAVAQLLAVNEQMQQQLAVAEGRLQEQAEKIESYAAEARTDPLTRLPNRRALDYEISKRVAEAQRTGKAFSIVMIDVDHFKTFNDTYGHQAGDDVLRNVADVLRRNVCERSTVARFGGEEFVAVLAEPSLKMAQARVERIRDAVHESGVQVNGHELRVTVSLGLAESNGGESATELVQRADTALYAAKQAGRNRGYWNDGKTSYPIQLVATPDPATAETRVCRDSDVATRPAVARSLPAAEEPQEISPASESGDMPNRMAFCTHLRHRLAEWRRGGQPPSVILVRVDEYDRILAVHGVRAGKQVLEATTRFLGAAVREMDVVASLGDRLFAILLPSAGLMNVVNISERLRQAIANCTLPADGNELRFTVSVGGAEADRGDDTAQLLRRAEEALLASTKSGGNCCYFHNGQWSETTAVAVERLQAR